jgi:ketosteroid isomerase-like protein
MTTERITGPSTSTASNAAAVAEIVCCVRPGDVSTILQRLAVDVAWDVWPRNYAQDAGVAHLSPRRGRSEVVGFFTVISEWSVREFDVEDIIGEGEQVVAQLHVEFDLPGGGRLHDEELHLWTFDDQGRVSAFRHYTDTAKHIAAQAGADTTPNSH